MVPHNEPKSLNVFSGKQKPHRDFGMSYFGFFMGPDFLKHLFDPRKIDNKEMFYVILLNAANVCLEYSQIGVGTITGVAVNVREIFHLTLLTNASAVIIAHNHPSGSLKVSEPDIVLTKKVIQGCRLFDVHLLDHIVLSSEGYCSLADEGLL